MGDKPWFYVGSAAFAALVAGLAAAAGSPALGVAFACFLAVGVTHLVVAATEFTPEEGVPVKLQSDRAKGFAPGFGRALIEQLPTALVLIERGGKISYANAPARVLVPRLQVGAHFANLFRAPTFVETVTKTLNDGKEREVSFSLTGSRQHFEARVARLPAELDPSGTGQVIVQIEDRTKAMMTDLMRQDFIANASHELRTPLASILGYVETLQGHAKDDSEAREQFLGIIDTQASRMQRLVDDLLSLSRIEMKEHVRPNEPCDVYALTRDSIEAMRPTAAKVEATLVDALPPDELCVPGDRDEILQVMHNLIDNALKYAGRGAEVRVAAKDPDQKRPGMLGIAVSDTGPGIAAEDLLRLTERFYRVSVLQSRNKGGTGLGLAIVKHIVNRHGGELQIESTIGEGSCFTVWLPNKPIMEDELTEYFDV